MGGDCRFLARESHSQPIGGHLYGWVDSHPHFAYRWSTTPIDSTVGSRPPLRAVSVLVGGKVDQGDRTGARGLEAETAGAAGEVGLGNVSSRLAAASNTSRLSCSGRARNDSNDSRAPFMRQQPGRPLCCAPAAVPSRVAAYCSALGHVSHGPGDVASESKRPEGL